MVEICITLTYVDTHGMSSNRIVEPLRFEGGLLTGFDLTESRIRDYAISKRSVLSLWTINGPSVIYFLPFSAEARRAIAPFAELERSPEHVHTYRITPLGLWNARAAGLDAESVVEEVSIYH